MKQKRTVILLITCLFFICFVFLLVKRNGAPNTYPFPNRDIEIKSIELIHNQNPEGYGILEENFCLLKELDASGIAAFMEDIYQLETKHRIGGPLWGYGEFFARIIYVNGDVEYLGSGNIELISENSKAGIASGEDQSGFGSYYFVGDEFISIFLKHAHIPEVNT